MAAASLQFGLCFTMEGTTLNKARRGEKPFPGLFLPECIMRYILIISIVLASTLVSACGSMYPMGDSSGGGGMNGSSASGNGQYMRPMQPLQPGDVYYGG